MQKETRLYFVKGTAIVLFLHPANFNARILNILLCDFAACMRVWS